MAGGLALCLPAATAATRAVQAAPSIRIERLAVVFAPTGQELPGWMRLDLTFTGQRGVLYLNATVGEIWVLQNIPVLSDEGAGVRQTVTYAFGLGPTGGTVPHAVAYGLSLTPDPLEQPPEPRATVTVGSGSVFGGCRFRGGPNEGGSTQPGPIKDPPLARGEKKHTHNGTFVNQDTPLNACGPAAMSNSLQWLNTKYGLGLKPEQISISTLGNHTGWDPKSGVGDDWVTLKSKYTEPLGITTKITPIRDVGSQLDAGCDVELQANGPKGGHIAAVTGIAKLADGRYTVDIAHDTTQGRAIKSGKQVNVPHNPATETITVDPNDQSTITGGTYLNGMQATRFVTECVKKKR